MSPILIFDLDDTLYLERSYVYSGFRAVSVYLNATRGWPVAQNMTFMKRVLNREGRGAIFNRLLAFHGDLSKSSVSECLKIYRQHVPEISITKSARYLLTHLLPPLYLVTDGHKLVQKRKIDALGIEHLFKKVFITHRYGLHRAKPSTYCFELIRNREKCKWSDMVYVGDNPSKDFVNLTPLGVKTVRVLTGEHRLVRAKPYHEASQVIDDLNELSHCIADLV